MAVNKVTYGGETLIDLTSDTVTADKLAQGITAHDKSGAAIVGTLVQQSGAQVKIGTITVTGMVGAKTVTVQHGLGTTPNFAAIFAANVSGSTTTSLLATTCYYANDSNADGAVAASYDYADGIGYRASLKKIVDSTTCNSSSVVFGAGNLFYPIGTYIYVIGVI